MHSVRYQRGYSAGAVSVHVEGDRAGGPELAGGTLVNWGWMAVASSLLSMLIYFGALMCTHLSAFRTARNMKTAALHHLAELPIGYLRGTGSGKLRRIIDDGAGQTETYLAHRLPDLAGAW